MSFFQKTIVILGFVTLTIVFSLPLIRSGLTYNFGVGYWGPTGHDMIWHQSLINHITNPFSIPISSFSGGKLVNYHPFYDIFIALIHQITSISINILIFQIFPLISSAVFIYLSFKIGYLLTKNKVSGYLLAIINISASSAGFIYTLFRYQKLGGESLFWSMQSASIQTNPPLILSLIFLQIIIIQIIKKQTSLLIILILILLPVTKAYGGVVGFLIWGIYSLSVIKTNRKPLFYLFLSLPLSFLLFKIYNPNSTSLFEFSPLWFIDQLFNSTDKLYFPRLASALYNLKLASSFKIIPIYIAGLTIFIIGNFFWRLLGYFFIKRNLTNLTINLLITSLVLTIIPLLFIQKGTAWNTIQFIYYSLFLGNILFLLFINSIKNNSFRYLLITLFFITSFLTNYDTYAGCLGNPPPSAIPSAELIALKFLDQQPAGNVLTYPYDPNILINPQTPIPLYAYINSAYIPAFTHHYTYVSDEMNLNNSGYNWQNRINSSLKFFEQKNQYQDRGFLVNNQIDYIYLTGQQISKTKLNNDLLSLNKIYDNGQTVIYRVNR